MLKLSAVVLAAVLWLDSATAASRDVPLRWSALEDPQLARLIDRALAANTDLREAVARVEAARAASGVARRDRLPRGGVGGAGQRVSLSASEAGTPGGRTPPVDVTSLDLAASWEIDLFGRLRSAERAARARAVSESFAAEAVRISVTAEVARTYLDLRAARDEHAIRVRYREHQAEIVTLSQVLVDEGRLPPGELARARAELAGDVAEVEAAQDEVVRLEAALAVLIGEVPGQWRLPAAADLTPLRFTVISLADADGLLRQRPDVRAAEQQLVAENEDVATTAAARYPRLDLTGLFGFVSGGLADLGNAGTQTWSIGGVLRWNLFDLPRVAAQVEVARAETRAALAVYDRTMLRAFEEAEFAVRRYASSHQQTEARVTQAREARIAAAAAQARYEEGASAYLDALAARRDALRADLAAAEAVAGQRIAVVGLLKALAVPPSS